MCKLVWSVDMKRLNLMQGVLVLETLPTVTKISDTMISFGVDKTVKKGETRCERGDKGEFFYTGTTESLMLEKFSLSVQSSYLDKI